MQSKKYKNLHLTTFLMEKFSDKDLDRIYNTHLRPFDKVEEVSFGKQTKTGNSIRKKNEKIRFFINVLENETQLKQLVKNLPPKVFNLYNFLFWEKNKVFDTKFLCEKFGVEILINSKIMHGFGKNKSAENISDDFLLLGVKVKSNFLYSNDANLFQHSFYFEPNFAPFFKNIFPPPKNYYFNPINKLGKTEFLFSESESTLKGVNFWKKYVAQGNLNLSKQGKILVSSLNKMGKSFTLTEFFEGTKDKNLKRLRANFVGEFLRNSDAESNLSRENLLKKMFHLFFSNKTYDFRLNLSFLEHISLTNFFKNWQNTYSDETVCRHNLLEFLSELKLEKWYAIESITDSLILQEVKIADSFRKGCNTEDIFFYESFDDFGRYKEKVYITTESEFENIIFKPFIKSFMFFLASFGLVDIAYDLPPESDEILIFKRDYFSAFDGLKYVRLNKLGAFVLGFSKAYEPTFELKPTKLTLDTKRLFINIEGNDPMKLYALETVGERINKYFFRVNFETFLKDVKTLSDFENKVAFFKNEISASPPQIWLDFFKEIRGKINPIKPCTSLKVFELNDNSELISFVAKDQKLKEWVTKAENFRIIIARKDIPKVKKRLQEFGYLFNEQ